MSDRGRESTGVLLSKILEEENGEIGGLWLRGGRVIFYPLGYESLMCLCPIVHVRAVCRVRFDPRLGKGVVQGRPLSYNVGVPLEHILLEPAFHVRRNGMPRFGAALIGHNWPERAGDTVAKRIVGRCQS